MNAGRPWRTMTILQGRPFSMPIFIPYTWSGRRKICVV